MDKKIQNQLAELIRGQRWASLATIHDYVPLASFVAYVVEENFNGFLIHISQLAPHTKNLLANPSASLAITSPDSGEGDPQMLPRVSISGKVTKLVRGSDDYNTVRDDYIKALPNAEQLFGFSDFVMFRLVPESARFVAGFAKSWDLALDELTKLPWR